jgi:hypothetical protein
MESRFNTACRVAGRLMAAGEIVFSPIAHTHPIAVRCELPRTWEYWQHYDREMIQHASKVLVVKMAGWQDSKGIAGEIEIANSLGIPVEYMEFPK